MSQHEVSEDEIKQTYSNSYRPYRDYTWFPFKDGYQAGLASQASKQQILVDAITEVLRVLESDNEAIVDTVWTTRGDNETLWEHCSHALEQVTGIEYKPAKQLPLSLESPPFQEIEEQTPAELRAEGRPYCPQCYTFGHVHRKDCLHRNDGIAKHVAIQQEKGE